MSVWNDIRKRANGSAIKKEDVVDKECLWSTWKVDLSDATNSQKNMSDISEGMKKLKYKQIKLGTKLTDLQKEFDKFRWRKCKPNVVTIYECLE